MLQRIQTVYLLLASALMLVAAITPLATFYLNGHPVVFEAIGLYQGKEMLSSTWGLFALGAISSLIALLTVFLYKTRMLQIRLTVFNIIVMVGFYAYLAFLMFRVNPESGLQFHKIGVGIIMPIIAIIFSYLAIRKIGADEILVRSLNRLR